MIHEIALKSRTIRSFDESRPVDEKTLRSIIDSARVSPSARNAQPLRYRLVTDKNECEAITAMSTFGGATPELHLPPDGHHPTAYIVVLRDTQIAPAESRLVMFDAGLACSVITLRAHEEGLGGVIIASFDPKKLADVLDLPRDLDPLIIMALGTPAESARVCYMPESGKCAYYRDADGVNCVPKRALEDVLIK